MRKTLANVPLTPAQSQLPERNGSAAARAYDELLTMILDRTIKNGEIIMERRFAAKFGVSRTPLREALRRLEGEGLVERQASGALAVREMTARDVIEALHVRRLLEGEAAATAAGKMPPEIVDRLIARIERLTRTASPDPQQHWTLDDDIHDAIAASSGNEILRAIVRSLRQRTRMFNLARVPERLEPGCHEHIKILKAIKTNKPDAAREAMVNHLDMAKLAIVKKLQAF